MTEGEEKFAPEWLKRELRDNPKGQKLSGGVALPTVSALRVHIVSCCIPKILNCGIVRGGTAVDVYFVMN